MQVTCDTAPGGTSQNVLNNEVEKRTQLYLSSPFCINKHLFILGAWG